MDMTRPADASLPYWGDVVRSQGRSLMWLAQQTGRTRRAVYAYSQGDRTPSDAWLAAASRALGVAVGRDPEQPEAA